MDGEKVSVTVSSVGDITPAANIGYSGRYEIIAKGRFTCRSIASSLRRPPDEALDTVDTECNNGVGFYVSTIYDKKSMYNEKLTVQYKGDRNAIPAKKGSLPYWLYETVMKDVKTKIKKEKVAAK